MKEYKCFKCGKELNGSEAYEYRGAISCEEHFEEVERNRDMERQEIIEEAKHKTERFKGLDLSNSVIGKANRDILKHSIGIAKKESIRRSRYESILCREL